jgi:DNA-binding transcriptional ArsR family regulator
MLVSYMANQLDHIFTALADPTRRAVIARLGQGEASVKTLAAPHDMALPSFLKHLDMLERAGLVQSRKDGRVRVCTLHPEAFAPAESWLDQQRGHWSGRIDRLAKLANGLADDERKTP